MYAINNKDVISADLLSVEEAYEIPQWILANGDWWWLRSPDYHSNNYAASIDIDGVVNLDGHNVNNYRVGVRPALKISDLQRLEMGDLVEVFGLKAQYIGNDSVLLCESIFNSRFDCESNIYETSEIRKKIDEWFNDMKKGGDDDKQ